MRHLGIDYGEKRIGYAVSDEAGGFAFVRETIVNDKKAIPTLVAAIIEEKIGHVVIGIPETASGAQNPVEADIRTFAEQLGTEAGVPIDFENEQFSSREASRFAPDGQKSDAVSAAIILQRYLDAHPNTQ